MDMYTDRNGLSALQTTVCRRAVHPSGRGILPPLQHDGLLAFTALAHEIKQPLTAILSNAQAAGRFLALDTPDLPEVRAALSDIIAAAHRTVEVIRRLQTFVTTGTLERTPLDINALVREVIQLVGREAATPPLQITLHLATPLPLVLGDRIQVRQVLLNLVRNACEAMPPGADGARTLMVRTGSETLEGLTVAVQDSGRGLDAAGLARLFQPGFTTKAGGMGLGLALSRAIIAAHGGGIWATRNAQRGLTVSFTLPLA